MKMWSYINPRYVFRSLSWYLPFSDRLVQERWTRRYALALAIALLTAPTARAQCVQSDGYPCISSELQQYNAEQQQQRDQQYNQMLQEDADQQIINQLNQLNPEQ